MATAKEIRDEADNQILKRLQGGAIAEYSLVDGRRIRRDSLESIMSTSNEFAQRDALTNGGMARFDFECYGPI